MGLDDHVGNSLGSEPAVVSAPSALDAAALERLSELDPTGAGHLLERVLKAFQTSAVRLRAQGLVARDAGDKNAIRLVVHTLKSSSASIGAIQLSQICAEIETTIRTADGEDLGPRLAAFDGALDDALAAIDRLLKDMA
jgi:HPt (histidine-containing phosphotransfer) domain-containing protein